MPNIPPSESPSSSTNGDAGFSAPQVVLIGASVRSAAFSALRAGLEPICFDQFADHDLQAFAEAICVENYPNGLIAHLDGHDDLPVVYTGAMENHPEVVSEILSRQPVVGNHPDVLTAIRDPIRVRAALSAAKVDCLEIRSQDDPPPADGSWLLKPILGAAGRGISVWDASASESATLQEPHYFQQRHDGASLSAVYVAAQDPLQVQYVGLSRQLVGLPELNASPFTWCGSIAPATLDTRGEILVRRIGTVLAHQFGLRGLFGCDFVLNTNGEPLLTEVNPRYTGSVEIIELLCGSTLITDHCRACGFELPPNLDARPALLPSGAVAGKVVMYSDRDLIVPDTSTWHHISPWQPMPGFADIPLTGSVVRQGTPVCTIFSAAMDFQTCEDQLMRSAADVRNLLATCPAA